jgi:hypothetical protein
VAARSRVSSETNRECCSFNQPDPDIALRQRTAQMIGGENWFMGSGQIVRSNQTPVFGASNLSGAGVSDERGRARPSCRLQTKLRNLIDLALTVWIENDRLAHLEAPQRLEFENGLRCPFSGGPDDIGRHACGDDLDVEWERGAELLPILLKSNLISSALCMRKSRGNNSRDGGTPSNLDRGSGREHSLPCGR